MASLMVKLQWIVIRIADKVGLAAGMAWLLLLAIVLYLLYVFLPVQQQLQLLEQQALETPKVQQVVYVYTSPSEQLFSKIPAINMLTTRIQSIFDLAKKQGIEINEVAYKDEKKLGETVVRYTMNFSIAASYPMIKAFIVDTLATLPYVALEKLTFERDGHNVNRISARLQFTLYLVR